jgi:hypothetical protein
MKERAILFSGDMVRAILEGRKTQTRRPIKAQPENGIDICLYSDTGFGIKNENGGCLCKSPKCPFGQAGDQLWVRETWGVMADKYHRIAYKADDSTAEVVLEGKRWRPSIHMPRCASRITLEVDEICVERVQDINYEGMIGEGFTAIEQFDGCFSQVWDSIYYKQGAGWAANPWVWVVKFHRLEVT